MVSYRLEDKLIRFQAHLDEDEWKLIFTMHDDHHPMGATELTGTGDEFKVFKFIHNALRDFLKEKHPKRLFFDANDPARAKLYQKMLIDRFLGKTFNVEKETDGEITSFALTAK